MTAEQGPLASLKTSLVSAQRDLGGRWQCLCDGFQHHLRETQDNFGRTVQHLGQHVATQQRQRQGTLSRLAVRPNCSSMAHRLCSAASTG